MDRRLALPVLFCAALAASAAAQDAALNDAFAAARRAAAATRTSLPAAPASCDDAKELETPFTLDFTPVDGGPKVSLRFTYAGCSWTPRNDYLPPYTERDYSAPGGYGLTLLTNDGEGRSEVLYSKGSAWLGRFGTQDNSALTSGNPVSITVTEGRAVLRDAAKPLYPQLKACESADWSAAALSAPRRDADGGLPTGYSGPVPSLVLLTKTAAYYYHEDCDICAAVTRCDLSTGALSSVIAAHSVDCSDMKPYRRDALFDSCAAAP